MAQVQVLPEYDVVAIGNSAGQANLPDILVDVVGGVYYLTVNGVTQNDLDTALATYEATFTATYLARVKTQYKNDVDIFAGNVRLQYITNIPGQAEVYQEKYDQAVEHAANSYPADLTSYPMIQAEVNATSLTAQQCSDAIIAERSTWLTNMASIEEARRSGKINIDAAADVAAALTARNNAITALQGL